MALRPTSDQTFETDTNHGIAVIDFWQDIGNGATQAAVDKAVADAMPDVNFFVMDVMQNHTIANRYQIKKSPTIMVKKNGKVLGTAEGYRPKEPLIAYINHLIK